MKEKEIVLDINGKDYKVKISRFSATEAEVSVNGTKYIVGLKDLGLEQVAEVKPQPAPRGPQATAPKTSALKKQSGSPVHRPKNITDSSQILAPLPGMITKIFIREGDVIKMGQPVMMLEAMKMENEVNATVEGMVLDIRYKEGDSVNQSDVLVLLKPVED